MCYILNTVYGCGHKLEGLTEQCNLYEGTEKSCAVLYPKVIETTKFCYECSIKKEALSLTVEDINEQSHLIIESVRGAFDMSENLSEGQEWLLQELQRCSDIYSQKLKSMEMEIQTFANDLLIPTPTRRCRPTTVKEAALERLAGKVEIICTSFREQVKLHENQ